MIGNMRWNFVFGCIGLVLTFIFSVTNNLFLTTIMRSLYCFLILFILGFVFRWLLGTIAGMENQVSPIENKVEDDHKGNHIDLQTPEDIQLVDALFSPLALPKLVSKEKFGTEDVVKAIRHLSED